MTAARFSAVPTFQRRGDKEGTTGEKVGTDARQAAPEVGTAWTWKGQHVDSRPGQLEDSPRLQT